MAGLAYLAVLGVALAFTHGSYDVSHIVLVSVCHVALAGIYVVRKGREPGYEYADRAMAIVLLVFVVMLAQDTWLFYEQHAEVVALEQLIRNCSVGAVIVVLLLELPDRKAVRILTVVALLGVVGGLLWARYRVLTVSPNPRIDTFVITQQAIDHYLAGRNPYLQEYPDLYRGLYGYRPGVNYWPGWIHWAGLGVRLAPELHDVRLSLVISEVLTTIGLVGLARQLGLRWRTGLLAAAVWLTLPIGLFVIEQCWVDPLLVTMLVGATWAFAARQYVIGGLLIGYACGSKQYAVVVAAFAFVFVFRAAGWKSALLTGLAMVIVPVALLAPYVLDDAQAVYTQTVEHFRAMEPRQDAFTAAAFISDAREVTALGAGATANLYRVLSAISAAISASLLVWFSWRGTALNLRRWLGVLFAVHGVIFLLAKQAFCNYYYYLAAFLLCALLAGWSERGTMRLDSRARASSPES